MMEFTLALEFTFSSQHSTSCNSLDFRDSCYFIQEDYLMNHRTVEPNTIPRNTTNAITAVA